MSMATKASLNGMWRIDRRILDARGPDAYFVGTVTFTAAMDDANTLIVAETGHLTVGDRAPLAARSEHKWVFATPTTVEVYFADGRPFHMIDLTAPKPSALHHCSPDEYHVEYVFVTADEWRTTWTVTGPRKDYVMTNTMKRSV